MNIRFDPRAQVLEHECEHEGVVNTRCDPRAQLLEHECEREGGVNTRWDPRAQLLEHECEQAGGVSIRWDPRAHILEHECEHEGGVYIMWDPRAPFSGVRKIREHRSRGRLGMVGLTLLCRQRAKRERSGHSSSTLVSLPVSWSSSSEQSSKENLSHRKAVRGKVTSRMRLKSNVPCRLRHF